MENGLLPATRGTGPLLQRDYWALLSDCRLNPSELMAHVKSRFCELPPASLAVFAAPEGVGLDAELDICIRPAQSCRVRVVHEDAQSLTLGTLEGHVEAGRITFGAYQNARGDVVFHIRSRARSANAATLLGFFALGDAMQTNTWTDFINNTATSVGAAVAGAIRAETQTVDEVAEDGDSRGAPTFIATSH